MAYSQKVTSHVQTDFCFQDKRFCLNFEKLYGEKREREKNTLLAKKIAKKIIKFTSAEAVYVFLII